jgi:hypothetical protein
MILIVSNEAVNAAQVKSKTGVDAELKSQLEAIAKSAA